jgi:site-specific recombinase XerD
MTTMFERYDQALEYCHDKNLPPGALRPKSTKSWPVENMALLEQYAEWLSGGGHSEVVIRTIYIPMAGHILGLALKPHQQLDLERDLQPGLDYIAAKGSGPDWLKVNRNALAKFRRFLLHSRGQIEIKATPYDADPHTEGLPKWLASELERYQRVQQRNWRPARLVENIRRFWSGHLRIWRYLCNERGVEKIDDLRRKHLYAYADYRLSLGRAVTGVNGDLRSFQGFMGFLQQQEYSIPKNLLRIPGLKEPERLPKHLTDEQVHALRQEFEEQVSRAATAAQCRDGLLTRAFFYLLWQCGMRKGEVEELRLEDLDLTAHKLSVRNGKGLKDRTVYMTNTSALALAAYLAVRGPGPTDHVFLYRNQALSKDLIHGRLKAAGSRVGVHVSAHRLRHTTATQLLNVGCPVTSIQKFLGHKKLNTTMVYARAYDKTVEEDYFAAMSRVEHRLALGPEPEPKQPLQADERDQLLALTEQLAQPDLTQQDRMNLVDIMRVLLGGTAPVECSVVSFDVNTAALPP